MWDSSDSARVKEQIGRLEPEMVEMQRRLVALPAISPVSGGVGEKAKIEYLAGLLRSWGLEVTEYRAPDERVPCGYRPSLTARVKGQRQRPVLWLMTHVGPPL